MFVMAVACIYINLVLYTSNAGLKRCKILKRTKGQSENRNEAKVISFRGMPATATIMIITTMFTMTCITINVSVTSSIQYKLHKQGISCKPIIRYFKSSPYIRDYRIWFHFTENDIGLSDGFWMMGQGMDYTVNTSLGRKSFNDKELEDYIKSQKSKTPD